MTNERITVQVCDLNDRIDTKVKIADLIALLQTTLRDVPDEHKDSATIHFCAYDWEGIPVEYEREPAEDEIKAAEAVFADREKLIAVTGLARMDAWIRQIRLRHGVSIEEATDMVRNDQCVGDLHPCFNRKVSMVVMGE